VGRSKHGRLGCGGGGKAGEGTEKCRVLVGRTTVQIVLRTVILGNPWQYNIINII